MRSRKSNNIITARRTTSGNNYDERDGLASHAGAGQVRRRFNAGGA